MKRNREKFRSVEAIEQGSKDGCGGSSQAREGAMPRRKNSANTHESGRL